MYVETSEVYQKAGITSAEVPVAAVEMFIREAESEVDRFVNATYWHIEQSSTATSATTTTLTDSARSFPKNEYVGDFVWVYSGTGSGQARKIESQTSTVFTLETAWTTTPDDTSKYRVIHTGTEAHITGEDGTFDGNGKADIVLPFYPVRILESLEIGGDSITVSSVHVYGDQGVLRLGVDSELSA